MLGAISLPADKPVLGESREVLGDVLMARRSRIDKLLDAGGPMPEAREETDASRLADHAQSPCQHFDWRVRNRIGKGGDVSGIARYRLA